MKYITFNYLCEEVGSLFMKKRNICFRIIVPVQERVAMSLYRLGSDDELQSIGDLYGVHNSTLSKRV